MGVRLCGFIALTIFSMTSMDFSARLRYTLRVAKLFSYFRYCLLPHHIIPGVIELDSALLIARGIRGVMLDLDNTLAPWHSQELFPGVEEWVAELYAAGLRACVVTNARTTDRVRPVALRLGIPWVTSAYKPLTRGFRRAMELMGTLPETTAMVGDLISLDVFGGNRLGVFTVLVQPKVVWDEDLPTRLLLRPLDRCIRGLCRHRKPSSR